MSTLLVAALLAFQAPPAAPASPASPAPPPPRGGEREEPPARGGWQPVNGVNLIVNNDCITRTEIARMAARDRRPTSTVEERRQRLSELTVAHLRRLLQVQGGKDLGYDQKMIDSLLRDRFIEDLERSGSIAGLADRLALEDTTSAEYKQAREAYIYEQIYALSNIGRFAGPGGRPYVDRKVRPGRLAFEFQRAGGRLDLPARVTLRELILPPKPGEELDAAQRRAGALRTRIAAGEDFVEAGLSAGAAQLSNGGLVELEEGEVLKNLPSLKPFLESARPGDLSEVLPYAPAGEILAFRIVRLEKRREAKAASFTDQDLQDGLTRLRQRALDELRLELGIHRLLEAAYVWPPEAFRGAKRSPPSTRSGTPAPQAGGERASEPAPAASPDPKEAPANAEGGGAADPG